MMTALRIHNFRTFRRLSVEGLTQVSLLVGANNAGKTSVLDAAELVLGGTNPAVLTLSSSRRGESSFREFGQGVVRESPNVAHLFHGHSLEVGTEFRIEAEAQGTRFLSCRVTEYPKDDRPSSAISSEPLSAAPDLGISLQGDRLQQGTLIPIDESGVVSDALRPRKIADPEWAIRFMGTASPPTRTISFLWDQVVLTPEEEQVITVLQVIEPSIARVAVLSGEGSLSRGGIFVKLKGSEQRIPLGSMGEGIKRLLVLSLNLVSAAGGYLLVDEIDTGLHHSVMVKMWKLVVEAAKRLNVQVLATTHSLDCVHALAELYAQQPDVRDAISLHRIERGAETSVRHSAEELLMAARHQMEVR